MTKRYNLRKSTNAWYPQTNSDFPDDIDNKSWALHFGMVDEHLVLFGDDSSAIEDVLTKELEPDTEYSGFPMLNSDEFQKVLDYLLNEGCIKIQLNGMHMRLVADFEGKG